MTAPPEPPRRERVKVADMLTGGVVMMPPPEWMATACHHQSVAGAVPAPPDNVVVTDHRPARCRTVAIGPQHSLMEIDDG